MKLKSTLVAAVFGRSSGRQIRLVEDRLFLEDRRKSRRVPLTAVYEIVTTRDGLWTDLTLNTVGEAWIVRGVSRTAARLFEGRVAKKIAADGVASSRSSRNMTRQGASMLLAGVLTISGSAKSCASAFTMIGR